MISKEAWSATAALVVVCLAVTPATYAQAKEYANASANADGVVVAAERSRVVGSEQPGSTTPTTVWQPGPGTPPTANSANTGWATPAGDAAQSAAQAWLPFGITDSGPIECVGPQGRSRTDNCRTRILSDTTTPNPADPATPPPAPGQPAPPAVDWRVVVDRAVLALNLPDATPHFGPDPSWNEWNAIPVGYPLWLWTDTGTRETTTTNDGITVHIRAHTLASRFTMGDGHTTVCTTTTVYDRARTTPGTPSPTCGYTYPHPGLYTVTAAVAWQAEWSANGASGTLTIERTGTRTLRINELESVITG